MKKYNIVYYSRTGKAKRVAEDLYKFLGSADADIEELIDQKNRNGLIGYLRAGMDSAKDHITQINTIKNPPSDYKEIILVTPIWAGKVSDAARTYIAMHRSDFRSFSLITVSGGSGGESAKKNIFLKFALRARVFVSLTRKDLAKSDLTPYFQELCEEESDE